VDLSGMLFTYRYSNRVLICNEQFLLYTQY